MCKYTGIDVSKETLDIAFLDAGGKWRWHKVPNDKKGFGQLVKIIPAGSSVTMEASGPYYLPLAKFLQGKGRDVRVANPLSVKRFSQMNLNRAKTDRKDAQVIAQYAAMEKEKPWAPSGRGANRMQQIITALESVAKQLTINRNQLGAFQATGDTCPQVARSLRSVIALLARTKAALEKELAAMANEHYGDTMERLMSIPGIGPKTAAMLVVVTDNFEKFVHYKQLIAYVGFSPRIYESGTSVRGKGHICKMGKGQVRKALYMCSWSAKKCNRACMEMYHRLLENGKPERVIKVALANKLLKMAFAVATKKELYSENYQPKICF
jgi:transposase